MKAQIFNYSFWANETDPTFLRKKYNKILLQADFTIMKFDEVYFEPFGYTAFWVLAESHFAIHTFPEENKTYFELSSCNFEKQESFKLLVQTNIEPSSDAH